MQALHGRAAGLAERRQAYYSVLQDDPDFVDDLHHLFTVSLATAKSRMEQG